MKGRSRKKKETSKQAKAAEIYYLVPDPTATVNNSTLTGQPLKKYKNKQNHKFKWVKKEIVESPVATPIPTLLPRITRNAQTPEPKKQELVLIKRQPQEISQPPKKEPKIKLNMLPTSNQTNNGMGQAKKYRAGIPRTFYAAQYDNSNVPDGIPKTFYAAHYDNSNVPNNHPITTSNHQQSKAPMPIQPEISEYHKEPGMSQSQEKQRYSPSDVYRNTEAPEQDKSSESPDFADKTNLKRQSAFERLGPREEPKKPKLTINLMCIRDKAVRAVVNETQQEDRFLPVHLRKDLIESKDEIVTKFLPVWPWKKHIGVTAYRHSKSVNLDLDSMEDFDRSQSFFIISIQGYPAKWRKEDVLDVLLENVKGKSCIPCFIEFTPKECKMLVIRCAPALQVLHKLGYFLRKNSVELQLRVSTITLTLNHLDFIPRLILRKILAQGYDHERKLNLQAFTLKPDISHIVYFPLNREQNQIELFQMLNVVAWDYLTDLDLSHNRLRFLDGFDLPNAVPKLKNLDLSFNCFEKITPLLSIKTMPLNSIKLEGNPLCHNYTDPAHYVKVLRMIFPSLKYIDGLKIILKGEFPPFKKNYCLESATPLVNKFLETFFPLLEGSLEDKTRIADMYDKKAALTITMDDELHTNPISRIFRNLFAGARHDLKSEYITGNSAIASIISKWPPLQHDPLTFNVDVMHHSDSSTILRINGILKIAAHTLADEEYYLSFTRSLVLTSKNGVYYKIQNELLYWEKPSKEVLDKAFRVNTVRAQPLKLKIDSLDHGTKQNLIAIFMTISDMDKKSSERCLELKEWNLKLALEHFMKLLKLDDLKSLSV